MNRRGFLQGLFASAAAVAIVDPIMPVMQVLAPAPVNATALYAELTAITRAAFLPKLHVQIYRTNPFLQHLMDQGMA